MLAPPAVDYSFARAEFAAQIENWRRTRPPDVDWDRERALSAWLEENPSRLPSEWPGVSRRASSDHDSEALRRKALLAVDISAVAGALTGRAAGSSWYELLPDGCVDYRRRHLGEHVATLCGEELGIPAPRIRWYRGATGERARQPGVFGFTGCENLPGFVTAASQDCVFINAEQAAGELTDVIAHETWHLARPHDREAFATAYGRRWREAVER